MARILYLHGRQPGSFDDLTKVCVHKGQRRALLPLPRIKIEARSRDRLVAGSR
jgi:hypothetical protein